MPPRSTKAPKLTTDDTTPLRTSPDLRLARNSSRCSRCVSSRYARRDSTTLLRFLSSSMILHSISRPTYGWRSRTRRRSTSDAGRKPRRPMSRIRPPLTTSMTGPLTMPSFSLISSIVPQARSYCARFLDRMRRPSLSSFWRTRASSSSSSETISCGSTSLRMESSRDGMTPSDLKPMSRSTSSLSILTTRPVTMSPSSNSTIVASTASANDRPPRSSKTTSSFWPSSSSSSSSTSAAASTSGTSATSSVVSSPSLFRARGGRWLPGWPRRPRRSPRGRWRWPPPSRPDPTTSCSLEIEPPTTLADRRARAAGPGIEAERHRLQVVPDLSKFSGRASRRATSSSSWWSSVGACARVRARASRRAPRSRRGPAPRASSSSSRAVKHVVQRSNGASVPSGPRTVATSCRTPVAASYSSPASRWRTANAAENALTASAPPGRSVAAIRPNTSVSSRPPSRPKPPWHRQMVASNSPGRSSSRTSSSSKDTSRSSVAAASRGQTDELGAVVDAHDVEATAGEGERVATRAAPHVEHPHPGLEPARRRGSRPPARSPW